jgi:hypothetical protein
MNLTNILLGTTSLFLIVGLVLSLNGLAEGRKSNDSIAELAQLKADIAKIEAEELALKPKPAGALATVSSPASGIPTAPDATDLAPLSEEMKNTIAGQEKMIEDSNNESPDAEDPPSPEVANPNTTDSEDSQMKSAALIKEAASLGTVTIAKKETALVIFTPSDGSELERGKIFSVRRGSGIMGQIQIDRLDESGVYVATMRPHGYSPDGYPDIQTGDTIIVTPQLPQSGNPIPPE